MPRPAPCRSSENDEEKYPKRRPDDPPFGEELEVVVVRLAHHHRLSRARRVRGERRGERADPDAKYRVVREHWPRTAPHLPPGQLVASRLGRLQEVAEAVHELAGFEQKLRRVEYDEDEPDAHADPG